MNEVPEDGGRPTVPGVPPAVRRILAELDHPSRLPILLALEQHPQTAHELVDELGLGADQVQFAIRRLRGSGLVTVVERRATTYNLVANVYGTPLTGWTAILDAVAAVAGSAAEEDK
jgi:DNA-binding transcriptional ArsR family regulator